MPYFLLGTKGYYQPGKKRKRRFVLFLRHRKVFVLVWMNAYLGTSGAKALRVRAKSVLTFFGFMREEVAKDKISDTCVWDFSFATVVGHLRHKNLVQLRRVMLWGIRKPGFPIPFHSLVISGPCPVKKSRTQRSPR